MAIGDLTPKRVYGPAQPGTSAANLYDVPTGFRLNIVEIIIANTTDADAWTSLSVGTTGIDTLASRIADKLNVPSPSAVSHGLVLIEPKLLILADTDFLVGKQGTASALTVTVNGVEEQIA